MISCKFIIIFALSNETLIQIISLQIGARSNFQKLLYTQTESIELKTIQMEIAVPESLRLWQIC